MSKNRAAANANRLTATARLEARGRGSETGRLSRSKLQTAPVAATSGGPGSAATPGPARHEDRRRDEEAGGREQEPDEDAARTIDVLHAVPARGQAHRAEHQVGPQHGHGFTVEGGAPA